jgi:UDP-glucose 4-epimerase
VSERRFDGQAFLVTGASGFIGGHLCRRLQALGATVHACSRNQQPAGSEVERWHQVDLGVPGAAAELVAQVEPEIVYHLASYVSGTREREAVLPTFHANLASAVYLLDASSDSRSCRRVLQAGSLEEPETGEPAVTPASPYAAAKWAASTYGRMFHQLYQTPVVLVRMFMVYGPGQRDLTKLVPYVTLSLLQGRTPQLSSGKRPVDWVYVEDVVDGLVAAADRPGLEGRRIDLGSGKLLPTRTVVEQIYSLLAPEEEPPFGTLPDRKMEQVRVARADETQELLEWSPSTSLDEGIAATVEWYREALAAGRIALPEEEAELHQGG